MVGVVSVPSETRSGFQMFNGFLRLSALGKHFAKLVLRFGVGVRGNKSKPSGKSRCSFRPVHPHLERKIALSARACRAEIMIFLRETNVILRLDPWASAGGWLVWVWDSIDVLKP